jgi:single-stranded-DNA-specific exonuclease
MTHLSLTNKRWHLVHEASEHLDLHTLLQALAQKRGISMNVRDEDLVQTMKNAMALMADLPVALERMRAAINNKELIGIIGDYDCDGITGSAILIRALKRHGCNPHWILPHRVRDGYGLKSWMIEELARRGTKLLITIDTGITAIHDIAMAREKGIDVIVIDHHSVKEELPAANALLHPTLAKNFPVPHPCAAGLVFGFVLSLEFACRGMAHHAPTELLKSWNDFETDLGFAAIGTIADVVPLLGINRLIVHEGIADLRSMKSGVLRELLVLAGCENAIDASAIGFRLAPRINAAGRMDDPAVALNALLGDRPALGSLELFNQKRQGTTEELFQKLKTVAADQLFHCHASEEYPAGIVGLLAGRLTEMTGRPALVASILNNVCTASLRSIPSYNIMNALEGCSGRLLTYGGHTQAAGCTFYREHFKAIEEALNRHIAESVAPSDLFPTLMVDGTLNKKILSLDLVRALECLAPFGQGNPEPRFLVEHCSLQYARTVGANSKHLQARLGPHKVIGFSLGHLIDHTAQPLDMVVHVGIDEWNGKKQLQLIVDDLRIAVQNPMLTRQPAGITNN